MFNEYDDLLTVDDFCQILNIGKNTAYKLLTNGAIKAFRTGRTWKIPKIYLEEYILKQCSENRQ